MTGRALEVRLAGSYNFARLERLIKDLQPIALLDTPRILSLDMRGLVFVGPAALALLVANLKRISDAGLLLDGSHMRPPRSSMTKNYLLRMDLFAHLAGVEVEEHFARKAPIGFRPCAQFMGVQDYGDVAKELADALAESCITDAVARSSIRICLDEIAENVVHHASTTSGGFGVAQGFKSSSEFEIGIADTGVGVRTSLLKNPDYGHVTDDADAITTALEPHVTSTPERNAGIGLFITKLLLAGNGGTLMVRSGRGAVRTGAVDVAEQMAMALPGTLVALRARTDRPLDIKAVYRQLEQTYDAAGDDGSTR